MQHTQTEITADSSTKHQGSLAPSHTLFSNVPCTPITDCTPCTTLPPSNLPPPLNPPACGSSAAGLEGRLLEGLALGPLALLEQRQRISGNEFRLVMPADVDAVIDLFIEAGASARLSASICTWCLTLCWLALG